MNLTPLYELKDRLEHAAIAGTSLIAEDFRLQRAVEGIAPLASASPVFAKIKTGADALLTAPIGERGAKLLDVLSLVDAVVYTQGITGISGDMQPLTIGTGGYVPASYGQLQPLIAALTGTGSGRMAVIEDAWENHPEYYSDFRVLPYVVTALGSNYSELADLAENILAAQGAGVIPLLKKAFLPSGKKEMVRRVKLVARLAGAAENEWFRAVLPDSKKTVREMLIAALSLSQGNTQLLLDLCRGERGSLKNAAFRSLACMNAPEARAFWEAEIKKNPALVKELEPVSSPLAADLVARAVREQLDGLTNEGGLTEAEVYESLRFCLYAMRGKYSDEMRDLWLWLSAHMNGLDQCQPVQNLRLTTCTVAEFLQKTLLETLLWSPCDETFALAREMSRRNPDWFLGAVFLVDLIELPAGEVYDKYARYLQDNKTAATEMARIQLLQDFSILAYHESGYSLDSFKKDLLNDNVTSVQIPVDGFDPRWAVLLTDPKVYEGVEIANLGAGWSDTRCKLNMDIVARNLLDPHSPELCAAFGEFFYRLVRETGNIGYYCNWLKLCGWTKWRGLPVHCVKMEGEVAWNHMIKNILANLPMSGSEKAAELREIDDLVQSRTVTFKYNIWPSTEVKMLIAQWEAE